jgi:hypothetical protein
VLPDLEKRSINLPRILGIDAPGQLDGYVRVCGFSEKNTANHPANVDVSLYITSTFDPASVHQAAGGHAREIWPQP